MPARHLLVVYDISDRRRWRRVYKLLCRHGEWLQLSAFGCRLGDTAARRLEAELRRLMDRLLVVELGGDDTAAAALRGLADIGALRPPQALIV